MRSARFTECANKLNVIIRQLCRDTIARGNEKGFSSI